MKTNIFPNTRYYRYLDETDDSLEVIKILGYQNTETVKYEVIKGELTGKRGKIAIKNMLDNYTKLNNDGIVSFSIAHLHKLDDIMIMFMKQKDLEQGVGTPYAVCRQCVTDIFHYAFSKRDKDYFGLSISQDSCPANVDFNNFLACEGVSKQVNIAYYIGDKLSDILSLFKHDDYNFVLDSLFKDHCKHASSGISFIYRDYLERTNLDGYVRTLESLLESNNFEYDIQSAFNIIPMNVDFSGDETGKIDLTDGAELSEDARCKLSFILRKNINRTLVLKYDKDIDLEALSHRLYQLVSDINNDIYLIAYDVLGEFHIPVESVESAENIETLNEIMDAKSVKDAYQYIRLNTWKYEGDKKNGN